VRGWFGGQNGDKGRYETIWALKDVTFEVQPGEVVGIIGRTGAGKSTLLKILSRITEPTTGRVEIRGRVGSLLEVGTGFHPELTGRENVYLNGAILGMRREEVDRRFDEIVAFAEVEKFIDTPVKHYSSGMYLRLAFAVASHLDADILLVDEVLAVGDAKFQQRCLGKMDSVARSGRTVLFVSHNLGAVKDLCPKGLLVDVGKLVMCGETSEVIQKYGAILSSDVEGEGAGWWTIITADYRSEDNITGGEKAGCLKLRGRLQVKDRMQRGYLIAVIEDAFGRTIVNRRMVVEKEAPQLLQPGRYDVSLEVDHLYPVPGPYCAYFKWLGTNKDGVEIREISSRAIFDVPGASEGAGKAIVTPPCRWRLETLQL
jgi:lipopolysaccharide transport system ATP-binding protein